MNLQDVCGQAAAANTARQLRGNEEDYDDGYDDGKGSYVTINDEGKHDNSHWGVYRDEPEKPKPKFSDNDLFHGYDACQQSIIRRNNLRAKPKSKDK